MFDLGRRLSCTNIAEIAGPDDNPLGPWLPRRVVDDEGEIQSVKGAEDVDPTDNPWLHGGAMFRASGEPIVPIRRGRWHWLADDGTPLDQPSTQQEPAISIQKVCTPWRGRRASSE